MSQTDDTRLLDSLVKELTNLNNTTVKVGFFEDRYDSKNDGLYVAQVAQWQEEGHRAGKSFAPPRPFLRTVFHFKVLSPEYKGYIGRQIGLVAKGKATSQDVLAKIGGHFTTEVKGIIKNGNMFKPNSYSWAAEKIKITGVYKPPLNFTGKLLASVKYKISKRGKNL